MDLISAVFKTGTQEIPSERTHAKNNLQVRVTHHSSNGIYICILGATDREINLPREQKFKYSGLLKAWRTRITKMLLVEL